MAVLHFSVERSYRTTVLCVCLCVYVRSTVPSFFLPYSVNASSLAFTCKHSGKLENSRHKKIVVTSVVSLCHTSVIAHVHVNNSVPSAAWETVKNLVVGSKLISAADMICRKL